MNKLFVLVCFRDVKIQEAAISSAREFDDSKKRSSWVNVLYHLQVNIHARRRIMVSQEEEEEEEYNAPCQKDVKVQYRSREFSSSQRLLLLLRGSTRGLE